MVMPSKRGTNSPREAGASREEIRYAVGRSSVGLVLVASGAGGVVSILVGLDPDQLVGELQARFPEAHLTRGDRDDENRARRVVDFVEDPAHGLDLPLDIRGTEFQRRVWQAVREIPAGRTTTYTEIARAIGSPRAMRAVGNACSTNNLAIAVPCHRVLHHDGSPSGGSYWGHDRQRILLDREAAAASEERPTPTARDD
jgi:AraC family transcriptional regulator, regulatory protein of adaptative response / methylated-DNA-[protein]-cysteine methyltransferase